MPIAHSLSFFTPLLEITLLTLFFNYLLKLFWGTRAMDVVFGFLAFLFLSLAASSLQWPVLERIMHNIINVAVLAVFVIFQPELRLVLSRLRLTGRRHGPVGQFEKFLESLTSSVYKLSEKQIGALIVLENKDSHETYATTSIKLQALFSSELLESLFMTRGPLHDGAVIIRGSSITAAGAILPLAHEGIDISRAMGTRHRAALGASQKSDALIIVVSEESGKVSLARDGIMTRGVKVDRFRGIVRSLFAPEENIQKFPLFKGARP